MSDYVELERAIEELERMIDARRQGIIFISHDFRPVWEKARDIQAIFNNGVKFPTSEMRQTVWERFRTLRDEASEVFKEQQGFTFDLLSDFNKTTIKNYDMNIEIFALDMHGVSKRGAFVIDKDGIIRYAEVCPAVTDQPDYNAIKVALESLN